MYFGQYQHQLDGNDRFRLPPKLRAKLGDKLYITQGTSECLFVFSEDDYKKLDDRLSAVPMLTGAKIQKAVRNLYSNADDPECDAQGRFRLAPNLKQHAGINKNIVFVGAGPRVEIWSEDGWKRYNEILDSDEPFDDVLDVLGQYGI